MAHDNSSTAVLCACAVTVLMFAGSPLRVDDTATQEELRQLKEANKAPQDQLRWASQICQSLN